MKLFLCVIIVLQSCYWEIDAKVQKYVYCAQSNSMLQYYSNTVQTEITNINDVGTLIIKLVPNFLRKIDMEPFRLPDQHQSLDVLHLYLTDLDVYNLSSLYSKMLRLYVNELNDIYIFDMKLGLKDTKMIGRYKAALTIWPLPEINKKGVITVTIPYLEMNVKLSFNVKELRATIDKFIMTLDDSNLNVDLDGDIFDAVANVGINLIMQIMQKHVVKMMSIPIGNHLNKILANLKVIW